MLIMNIMIAVDMMVITNTMIDANEYSIVIAIDMSRKRMLRSNGNNTCLGGGGKASEFKFGQKVP